jgi:hypothetical protein
MTRIAKTMLAAALATIGVAALAQAISPVLEFEGSTTTPSGNGTVQAVHIVVERWGVAGHRNQQGPAQQIPTNGHLALGHLLGGEMTVTLGTQATRRTTGDY